LDWLVIELPWVDEASRRAGHGRRLLASAEAEAPAPRLSPRPGRHLQLPDPGYERFATMDDCPIGHQRYFYARALL
jgi:hypothetical protein